MRVALCIAFGLVFSCGARTELGGEGLDDGSTPHDGAIDHAEDAAVDVSADVFGDVANDAAQGPLCAVVDAGIPLTTCNATLVAGFIQPSSFTCFVDTIVKTSSEGTLVYACKGDPSTRASADFDGGTFAGSIQGTNVDICSGTTFSYSDGCTWASAQRIFGDLSTGALTFTYVEAPIDGLHCLPACSAHGTLTVQ